MWGSSGWRGGELDVAPPCLVIFRFKRPLHGSRISIDFADIYGVLMAAESTMDVS